MTNKILSLKKTAMVSALLLELTASAQAATIVVDEVNCTLADAIVAASSNMVTGGCVAGSDVDDDVIELPADTEIVLTTALPLIEKDSTLNVSSITINGNGATISRDAGATNFTVLSANLNRFTALNLNDLTVMGGHVNGSSNIGGGINHVGGILKLDRCIVSDNTGGAVYTYDADVTIEHSVIANNKGVANASSNAAGLTFKAGYEGYSLTVSDSTIASNNNYGTAEAGGVSITSEYAYAYSDALIENSTISNNSTENGGGGINAHGEGYFGSNVMLNLVGVTLVNNSTAIDGGGLFNDAAFVRIKQSLVAGNSAGNLVDEIANSGGGVVLNDYNLFGLDGNAGMFGVSPGPTDMIINESTLSAVLNPILSDNGGYTPTHSLVSGSPAIDFIPAASCLMVADQTGKGRPIDGDGDGTADCDVGAFEFSDVIFSNGFE